MIRSSPHRCRRRPTRRTFTRSSLALGRFFPTKSGRIGSSRWPRSTSVARRTTAGRPMSCSASSAARMLRPEKSTSSTRTTTLPSIPPGGDLRRLRRPRGIAVQVVAVHRDVERADGDARASPLELGDQGGDAVREGDASSGDAEKHEALGTLVGLEDLVRDPSQGPGDVRFMQHGARAHPRSLLRLTGRG